MTTRLLNPVEVDLSGAHVLSADDVGGMWALHDLIARGYLKRLFAGTACLPEHDVAQVRARSLVKYLPTRVTVSGLSALWVWTGLIPIHRLQISYSPLRRSPTIHWSRRAVRQELSPAEVIDIAGVQVTSLQRTYLDVVDRLVKGHPAVKELESLMG